MKTETKLPKRIVLTITKDDCEGDFFSCTDCAVARSFKRTYPGRRVLEGVDELTTWKGFNADQVDFKHREFNDTDFDRIKKTGKSVKLILTRQ